MSASKKKKIIALGDYLQKKDEVEEIELSDCSILIRIKKPSTEDSMKMMELLAQSLSEEDIKDFQESIKKVEDKPMDKKLELLKFSYQQDAMLISSCCYYPTLNGDGKLANIQEDDPKKIWESFEDALQLPKELFDAISERLGKRKLVMSEVEAKK